MGPATVLKEIVCSVDCGGQMKHTPTRRPAGYGSAFCHGETDCGGFSLQDQSVKTGPLGSHYATVRLVLRPILLDPRRQWIARNTNDARRSPQRYIVVRRKESPWVPEESLRRFAWHGHSER
jgi:hypothetical protein